MLLFGNPRVSSVCTRSGVSRCGPAIKPLTTRAPVSILRPIMPAARATGENAPDSPFSRQIPLAGQEGGGAMWLLDPASDGYFNVHGSTWIIQRPETFAKIFPKLRLRKLHARSHEIQVVPKAGNALPECTAIVRGDATADSHMHLPVVYQDETFFDITEFLEERDRELQESAPLAGQAPAAGRPGLVQVQTDTAAEEEQDPVFVGSSSSPRRTKMMAFTCMRCKARNLKPVNPLAFEEGTLVVQCTKCQNWHKIRDHLHLFHDMMGEVFFRPPAITNEDIPESLRMPLEPFYWSNAKEEGDK